MKKHYLLFVLSLFFIQKSQAQVSSLNEDFTACMGTLPNSWLQYSVTGSDAWSCTSFGHVGNAVMMSGYSNSSNNTNEDWLISPSLNLAGYGNASMSFWSRTKYSGSLITVLISTNYTGTGNPNTATWTSLNAMLPSINSDYWAISNAINLNAYKSMPCRIAFKYTSSTSSASTWRLDDIVVQDLDFSVSEKFMNVGEANVGAYSNSSSFTFIKNSITGNLHVNAPAPFQVSKDNSSFSSQLTYTSSANAIAQTVYVRINPTQADKVSRDVITFDQDGNNLFAKIYLLGTSMPDNKTLRVMNWNMRWFGDALNCSCDTSLARKNSFEIMQDAHADLYVLQEVVDINRLQNIATQLGSNYVVAVSPFGSGAVNTSSVNYADAQKLAYIFNSTKIQNAGTFGLLASTYPSLSGNTSPYYCFSSGRYPFMLKAKLVLQPSQNDTIFFANIHAKASGTQSDYDRRKCAAEYMTDSLLALYPNKKVIVAGDFNDYLEGTSVNGNTNSPYQYLLANGFVGKTLASLFPNQTTFVNSSNHLIDNVVCSASANAVNVNSTTFIFNEVNDYIPSYTATTSDHLPVISYYKFDFPNAIESIASNNNEMFHLINPSSNTLNLFINESLSENANLVVYDLLGNKISEQLIWPLTQQYKLELPSLNAGIYFIQLKTSKQTAIQKWLVR